MYCGPKGFIFWLQYLEWPMGENRHVAVLPVRHPVLIHRSSDQVALIAVKTVKRRFHTYLKVLLSNSFFCNPLDITKFLCLSFCCFSSLQVKLHHDQLNRTSRFRWLVFHQQHQTGSLLPLRTEWSTGGRGSKLKDTLLKLIM